MIVLNIGVTLKAQDYDLNEVRISLYKAMISDDNIPAYYELSQQIEGPDATTKAYYATGFILKAKNEWNPFEQLALAFKYLKIIQEAVDQAPHSIEVRFLRFAVAFYLPNILGFKKNMLCDKEVILQNLGQVEMLNIDPVFNDYIVSFAKKSGYYNEEEMGMVETYLK